ncbi:FAD-binding domain-containing protein [Leucogyrophana mollusca]|uniref:FAD-binding domain-containing protein n=1 Tax=Leucogyrophana mollusca TaxID=85980 RepID=A0ACB8BYA3_9AGAM|nr:FAD-binding domain-containing protein [Leucogyrophana mollusca]
MRIFFLFSLLALGYASSPSPEFGSRCRCTADQACWPSASVFSDFEKSISQPLIYPLPPASACYPSSSPSGNCTEALENWDDGNWRANHSGASQSPNFETYTWRNGTISACYKETSLGVPCGQGSVPVVGIDAREPSDIQAAVNFAVKHNLRLTVKNTGHDYFGRSSGRGSFLVWTHNMKDISYNASFVPQGAPRHSGASTAITLGAGVQWHEAYDAANAQGQILVGGASAGGSVGAAGGWLLGGGHSALSPKYGLGVDNVLEMTIVTSTGEHLTVNDYQHADLFWALRGGGGGTYGIVTSVTYRTYPSFGLVAGYFVATANNTDVMRKVVTEYVRVHPSLSDAGWSGYSTLSNASLTFFYIMANGTEVAANSSMNPFFDFAKNLTSEGLTISTALTYAYPSWYAWYAGLFAHGDQNGANVQTGSRLLPRETFEYNYKELANALLELDGVAFNFVGGGQMAKINPDSVGVNPAWRRTLVHITFGTGWQDGSTVEEIQQNIGALKAKIKRIRDLTPFSGAYFNEASLYETNPQYTFFGFHYPILKVIKLKYDPHSLFVVQEGVGSEDWNSDLTCRRTLL